MPKKIMKDWSKRCVVCACSFTPIWFHSERSKWRPASTTATCSTDCRHTLASATAKRRPPRCGLNHPNWKGGTSAGLGLSRGRGWPKIAARVREEQKYHCGHCDAPQANLDSTLEVHHIVPFHNFLTAKAANRRANLIALCKSCHRKADAAVEGVQLSLRLYEQSRTGVPARGERQGLAKLTNESVRQARILRDEGLSWSVIAVRYGVNLTTIASACSRKTWAHVP